MKRVAGFIMFWLAAGMLLTLFIHSILIELLLICIFFLVGYNLFIC